MKPRKNQSNAFFLFRLAMVARTEPMIRPRKSDGKSIATTGGAGGGAVSACATKTLIVIIPKANKLCESARESKRA